MNILKDVQLHIYIAIFTLLKNILIAMGQKWYQMQYPCQYGEVNLPSSMSALWSSLRVIIFLPYWLDSGYNIDCLGINQDYVEQVAIIYEAIVHWWRSWSVCSWYDGNSEEETPESAGDVFLFSLLCLAPEEEILRRGLLCLCSFRQKPTHWRCRQERI